MEEPEFWAAVSYSEAFKREWLNVYGEEWIPPHASHDAQYRASKLKAAMYYRALDRICSAMKEYALATYGRTVRFYIPTHSLINYAQWRIVSPEALAFRGEEAEFKENRLLDIQRGPYRIAHLLDEAGCADPVVLEGSFVRLFDDRLSLATRLELMPNGNVLLYDLDYDAGNRGQARILAASSRIRKEIHSEGVALDGGIPGRDSRQHPGLGAASAAAGVRGRRGRHVRL